MSYRKIGITTVAVTQDLLSGMPLVIKIELICLWNSILPEPGQPSVQLSKLIHLTACKKAKHAISRWYRTVYIPWLVTSYDTHKGKHWLNSNPPNHRVQMCTHPCPRLSCLASFTLTLVLDSPVLLHSQLMHLYLPLSLCRFEHYFNFWVQLLQLRFFKFPFFVSNI